VTILTTNKTLAFVSLLVQLNNKQSINLITSLCWSYFKTKLLPGYILPKYQAFLAALQVTEITASLTAKPTERQNERATTLHYHYHYHYHG
jgi:hypothetical protein